MVDLIRKYNVPGPRYTSYPTVPYWDQKKMLENDWKEHVQNTYEQEGAKGISLYIHLPFCESLCTFCGCHKRITKNHSVEEPYITTLIKEWELYVDFLGNDVKINEIHLGGGTPTFFQSKNLIELINSIKSRSTFSNTIELSIEAHPNNTSEEHLKALYSIGFKRISFGIQDYDAKVQKTINRVQSFDSVKEVHTLAKKVGFNSISHDLVYGLPFQSLATIKNTIDLTLQLAPERISFYSYAHVPWIKGVGQRGYSALDLPQDDEKRALYEYGKQMFADAGYEEVGMDHFAKQTDKLFIAQEQKKLHRNFMGYTTTDTKLMIGLGMSSISDSWGAFAQNVKHVEEYQDLVNSGVIPVFRGHSLSKEDLLIRNLILDLMCKFETVIPESLLENPNVDTDTLRELIEDGICKLKGNQLTITEIGKAFVRNVCMCFDLKMNAKQFEKPTFSKTI